MNRIYKVIFNRTKGQYEVVPEIAKNGGKAPKRTTGRHLHRSAGILPTAMLLSSLLLSGGTCAAAAVHDGDTLIAGENITITQDGDGKTNNITIAANGVAKQKDLDDAKKGVTANKTQIDTNTKDIATNGDNINKNSAAIKQNQDNIAANKQSIDKNTAAITDDKQKITKNSSDIAANTANITKNATAIEANKTSINKNASDISELQKVNASLGLSNGKSGIKYFRTSSSGTDDDATAKGTDALAVGKNASALSDKTIAIGVQAKASGSGAIAIGGEIRTADETARGTGAEAAADNAAAIGTNAEVTKSAINGIAIGHGAITGVRSGMTPDDGTAALTGGGGKNSISIGNEANARGGSAIALGDHAVVMNDASGSTDVQGRTVSQNGIAIGTQSKSVSQNAMAIGYKATITYGSTGATAIGAEAQATKENALAIGTKAAVDHENALAMGTSAQAIKDEAIAIGKETQAAGDTSIAMGSGTTAKANNVVAIGHKAEANVVNSIVIGEEAGQGMTSYTTNVNGSHVMIGNKAGQNVDGQEDISLGFKSGNNVKGNYNIAIGSEAGTFIGKQASSTTENSSDGKNVSIGFHANHYDETTAASISEATALGAETVANKYSTAIGSKAKATAETSTAIGYTSLAADEDAIAIGNGAEAHGIGNIAIGKGSLVTTEMSARTPYLSDHSVATQVISVGNATTSSLRRIANVADGADLQDAATINQLQKLQHELESKIPATPTGTSTGDAVTYSGDNNQYVRLKSKTDGTVQIKNVADGELATDAVNKGQLDNAVEQAKVHYYSVKTDNNGTVENNSNYNNDSALGTNSLAIGIKAAVTTDAERGVAIGNNVQAQSVGSIALGTGYQDETTKKLIDTKAISGYQYNMAMGAGAQSAGNNSLAIGTRATTQQQQGTGAAENNDAIAIGYLAETSNVRGVAMGAQAKSSGHSANAIGDQANAEGENSIAFGTNSSSSSLNSIAIGNETSAANGTSDTVIGNKSTTSKAANANVFGINSSITNDQPDTDHHDLRIHDSSIVGNSNEITRNDAAEIRNVMISGNSNKVQGSTEKDPLDADILDEINITGTSNTVTLKDNTQPVKDITIMGNENTVEGSSVLPMKGGTSLSKIQILGSKVTANVANSVYLGTESKATAEATDTTAGSSNYTGGTYDRDAAGQTAVGVVTIGSVGNERRLQNVAAGLVSEKSTDAVNGSQLFLRTQPLRFAGDNSTIGTTSADDHDVLHRRSDQAMTIQGGIKDDTKLSKDNIGVIADAVNNTMTVKLANDVKVNSVTTGSTVMNNNGVTNGKTTLNKDGITITNPTDANKNIVINDGNITFGGNQVNKMGSGSDGTDSNGHLTYNTNTNGANIGDAKNISDARRTIVESTDGSVTVTDENESDKNAVNHKYNLSVDYGKAANAVDLKYTGDQDENGNITKGQNKLSESVAFNGTSNQIVTKAENGKVTFCLADEVNIGKDADGNDGKLNIGEKDGSSVVIGKDALPNGNTRKPGLAVNGTDGQNGVTMWADTKNNSTEGHIGLNGAKTADGQQGAFANIWADYSKNMLSPVNKDDKTTRILYKDRQDKQHEIATTEDGQKYKGDFGNNGQAAAVQLNHQVNIVGDISSYNKNHPDSKVDESALTKDTANVGVVTSTDGAGKATLAIRLNKDLHIDSTTMEKKDAQGNVINSNITNAEGSTITKKNAKGQNAASTTANAGSLTIQNGKTKTTIDKSGIATNHINVGEKTRIGDAAAKIGNVDIDGKKGQVKVGTNTTLNDGFAVIDGVKVGQHKANDTNLTIYNKDGKATTKKDTAGKYVTGLTNKTWNADNSYVSGRAATEDQLHQIVKDLIGPSSTGGFGLSANGGSVKKALGETIAINGDGTYDAAGKQTTAGNIITSVDGSAIKVALNRDLNIDSTTMEKTNNDGTKVSNVTNAEGSTMTKTDAQGNTSSTTVNAGSLTIKNGDVTTTIDKDGVKTNKVKVGENTTIDDGSATIGKVSINGNGEKDGATNKEHTSTITGLSNKEFDTNNLNKYKDSGRAATEAQLKVVYDKASQHTTVTVNGGSEADSSDGNIVLKKKDEAGKGSNYDLSLNDDIKLGKDKDGRLTVQSKDGSKSITTDGSTGTLTFKDGQKEVSVNAADAANGVDGTSIKRAAMDGHTIATLDDGMKYAGDTGDALKQKLNSTTNIKGGISDTTKLSDNNIGVVSDGKDTLTVKLAKDIKGLNSMEVTTVNAETVNADTFKAGNTTINNNGLTINTSDQSRAITIQDNHISMGGNQIHNVAPGTADDDAVNVSQLKKLGGEVSNVSNRVNRVGAGAAALAALHPQDFDPDDKWDFAVGYGNYRGANAAAVGAFYQPNEDTTLSVGGTVGGGENMVNVGVSWKFGQGNHITRSRVAMAKDILALQNQVNVLSQKLAAYEAAGQQPKALPATGTMTFPDVPENHWAYQYVKYLAERGYLQGYPDGEFKGDRAMTRYEYAAIIYRALQNGAPSDGNMARSVDEFGPELTKVQNIDRFRVDRISGKDNDRHKIERVRVNSQDNKEKNDYRDVYGSRIAQ